jgi:hypothetical protein
MTKKRAVSPLASGGAGTLFEYRVAAIMLVHLLRGAHAPGLQVPVVQVGLQQRVRGHLLDDIVVCGEPTSLRTEFQVKQKLSVTKADGEFIDVVTQALHVLHERADEVQRGDLALGVIAEGEPSPLDQLERLTRWAQSHSTHSSFGDFMVQGIVDETYRNRLARVQEAVARAIEDGAPDLGGVEQTAHQLLSVLHVWRPTVTDDGATYLAALDQLQPAADEFSVTSATLFSHLEAIAKDWGPHGGVADAAHVRRRLRWRGLIGATAALAPGSVGIDVDAVVRGPIEALNLRHEVAAAEAGLTGGDLGAADAFGAVAERLRAAHFVPDAMVMLRRRADALHAAGQADDAVVARIGIAWEELDRVRIYEAGFALNDGRRPGLAPALSASVRRVQAAADAAVAVAKGAGLDRMAGRFDSLQRDDQHAARSAVFLSEEAIAESRPQLLLDRLDQLQAVARAAAGDHDERSRLYAVRIQMCVADATGGWLDLLRGALRAQPRPVVAWLHARYARYSALTGDGPSAQEHYLEAIERATVEEMFDDAADWLYALRTVRFWYDNTLSDDQHPRAQAMRPHAKPSNLPGATHTGELALRAMLDEAKPAEALQRVRRWLWQSVVRAHITEELGAVNAVGMLLQRRGAVEEAVNSYIRAGAGDKATAAGQTLPERAARIQPATLTPIPTSRAAAYRAATAAVDLMDDELIQAWVDEALDEITNGPGRASLSGASPYLRAFDFLADACDILTPAQDERLHRKVEDLVARTSGQGFKSNQATAKIFVTLSTRRPELIPILWQAFIADEGMAEVILSRLHRLQEPGRHIGQYLNPFAADNELACRAIISAGGDPTSTIGLARSRVDRELRPRRHDPNSPPDYPGGADVAVLASVLDLETRRRFATTMLERSLDQRESMYSRWGDLAGLHNIAGDIDLETKAALLPRVLEIARGEHEHGPGIDDDERQLAPLALQAASRLNPNAEQSAQIEQVGLATLQTAKDADQWRIVRGMMLLPAGHSRLDLRACAVHPGPAVRTLAAIRWAQNPSVLPQSRAASLAADSHGRVRRELAGALSADDGQLTDDVRDIIATLATDVRRSVRTPAIAAQARQGQA